MTLVQALHTIGNQAAAPAVRGEAAAILLAELQRLGARHFGRYPELVDDASQKIVIRLWTKPHVVQATTDAQASGYLSQSLHREMYKQLRKRGEHVSLHTLDRDFVHGQVGAEAQLDERRAEADDLDEVIQAALEKTQDPRKWHDLLVEIRVLSTEGTALIDVVRQEQADLGVTDPKAIKRAEYSRRQNHTRARKYVHKHLDTWPYVTLREQERVDELRARFDDVYRFNKKSP